MCWVIWDHDVAQTIVSVCNQFVGLNLHIWRLQFFLSTNIPSPSPGRCVESTVGTFMFKLIRCFHCWGNSILDGWVRAIVEYWVQCQFCHVTLLGKHEGAAHCWGLEVSSQKQSLHFFDFNKVEFFLPISKKKDSRLNTTASESRLYIRVQICKYILRTISKFCTLLPKKAWPAFVKYKYRTDRGLSRKKVSK